MQSARIRGFTLIELMVTVAIIAIAAAIAFPNFQGALRSNRVATTSNELIASLSLARSEAIRNPSGAAVCPSADGASCDAAGAWHGGWAVWIDLDGDGVIDGGERVLRHVQARHQMEIGGTPLPIRFDNRGRTIGGVRALAVEPEGCPAQADLRRDLTVSATGQVRVTRATCT